MKHFILTGLFGTALLAMAFSGFRSDTDNPHKDPENPLGYIMAEGELNCLGCHSPVIFKKPNVDPNEYMESGFELGKEYTFSFSMDVPVKFNVVEYYATGMDENLKVAGKVGLEGEGQFKSLTEENNLEEILYAAAVAENVGEGKKEQTFTINWTAPEVADGPVTISLAGVASNGDGTPDGDMVFQSSIEVHPAIKAVYDLTVYPTIATNQINLNYTLDKDEAVEVTVFDINGALVEVLQSEEALAGTHSNSFELGDSYQTGMYLMQTQIGKQISTERFLVNR